MFSRLEVCRRSIVALVVMLVVVMGLHLGTPSRAYSNAAPQILGKTYGEWSAVWWQWALTEPEEPTQC